MKKKHILLAAIGSVVLLSLLSGSYLLLNSGNDRRTLLIGGSSTVSPYTKALAEAYMKQNPNISIVYESGGSTPGLIAVKNKSIDIASMSRDLEDNEDDEYTNNYLIGKDAVGIIVHPSNTVENLTVDQVKSIFTGSINNWSTVGGKAGRIRVITRTPESTTFKGLDEIVLKGTDITDSAVITSSAAEMAQTVAVSPYSIGFLALKDLKSSVKALKINGVELVRPAILTDRYPISRSFYFVVYDISDYQAKTQENFLSKITGFFKTDDEALLKIRAETIFGFLDFARSTEGQGIIEKEGAIGVY